MLGNSYGYFYPPQTPPNGFSGQQWNNWSTELPQFVHDFTRPPPPIPVNYINNHSVPRPHGYHNNAAPNSTRHYSSRSRYNNSGSNKFASASQQSWSRNQNSYKKPRLDTDVFELKSKSAKKKKPLSQNVPSKRGWTLEDAQRALTIEKEYNKRFKNNSLIIKFPDLELNKDIVSKFHPAIENVHFQQPSTARFCFVTLQPSVDADAVIETLNKQKFGDGYLSAEYKKDRDEDQVILPVDIDPLTLYVGNLAQEVTKEDMVRTYPKSRRIDIGYAKKMKYTRYAFIGFKNLNDCLEAFKSTHSTEMYSKSLIVRFRRINGTVGMPGECKPPNTPRATSESNSETLDGVSDKLLQNTSNELIIEDDDDDSVGTNSHGNDIIKVDLNSVKDEPKSDDEIERKPIISPDYVSPFLPGSLEHAFAKHRPIVKKEVKVETQTDDNAGENSVSNNGQVKAESNVEHSVKKEPECTIKTEPLCEDLDDDEYGGGSRECIYQNESDDDYDDYEENMAERFSDFNSLYQNMVNRIDIINSLKKTVTE